MWKAAESRSAASACSNDKALKRLAAGACGSATTARSPQTVAFETAPPPLRRRGQVTGPDHAAPVVRCWCWVLRNRPQNESQRGRVMDRWSHACGRCGRRSMAVSASIAAGAMPDSVRRLMTSVDSLASSSAAAMRQYQLSAVGERNRTHQARSVAGGPQERQSRSQEQRCSSVSCLRHWRNSRHHRGVDGRHRPPQPKATHTFCWSQLVGSAVSHWSAVHARPKVGAGKDDDERETTAPELSILTMPVSAPAARIALRAGGPAAARLARPAAAQYCPLNGVPAASKATNGGASVRASA